MGRRYSQTVSAATNTGSTTLQQTTGATTIRPQIYDMVLSAGGVAPADNAAEYQLRRFSTPGTCTTATPAALDNGDPASLLSLGASTGSGFSCTAEPTTALTVLLDIGVNMRATFRSTGLAA